MAEQNCGNCGGRGVVPCQGCSGTVDKGLYDSWSNCSSCHGKKVLTCPKCLGSGKC